MPLVRPTVPTAEVLVVHMPPGVGSESVIVVPTHWLAGPNIAGTIGIVSTFNILIADPMPQLVLTI